MAEQKQTTHAIQLSQIPIPSFDASQNNDVVMIPTDDFDGDVSDYDISAINSNTTVLSSKTENLSISASSLNSDPNGDITINTNIQEWGPSHIKNFLENMDLIVYFSLFRDKGWLNGDKIISLTEDDLYNGANNYFKNHRKYTSLSDSNFEKILRNECKKIIREINKLLENEYDDIVEQNLSVGDIQEFERRLNVFIEKWERIDWIYEYTKDWNGRYII